MGVDGGLGFDPLQEVAQEWRGATQAENYLQTLLIEKSKKFYYNKILLGFLCGCRTNTILETYVKKQVKNYMPLPGCQLL